MADFTVRDIAVHIQRPGESLTAAIDRLRNWTDMGVIKAKGKKTPGTGHKRRYSKDALLRAVILQLVTDASSFPAAVAAASLDDLIKQFTRSAVSGSTSELVVVSKEPDAQRLSFVTVKADKLGEFIKNSEFDVHTVFSPRSIWVRLQMAMKIPVE